MLQKNTTAKFLTFQFLILQLGKIITAISFFLIGLSLLNGCIPTVGTVYKTPEVNGTVIALQTGETMSGIIVKHKQYPNVTTMTDETGEFNLAAVQHIEASMLMPGHAIADYAVVFQAPTVVFSVNAQSSLFMRKKEVVDLATVLVDLNPQDLAPPITENGLGFNVLNQAFEANGPLSRCKTEAKNNALYHLNVLRKVFYPDRFKVSNMTLMKVNQESYTRQTQQLWSKLRYFCERTTANYKAFDKVTDAVTEELETLIEKI